MRRRNGHRSQAPHTRGRLAVVCALLLLGVGLLSAFQPARAAGPYPPPSTGHGWVDPSHVKVGECVIFSGDGFAPGALVEIRDNGKPVGVTHAGPDGVFHFKVCFAFGDARGRHVLTGTGLGADGRPLTVSAVVIVEGIRVSAPPGEGVSGDGAGGGAGDQPVGLPFTGAQLAALLTLGAAFAGSGVLLVISGRSRRRGRADVGGHRRA